MRIQVLPIDRAARELSKTPLIVFIWPLLTEIETILLHLMEVIGSKSGSLSFDSALTFVSQHTPYFIFHFRHHSSICTIRQPLLFIAIIASAIPLVNTTYRCQSTLTTCSRFCLQCSPVSVYSCPVFVYRIRNNGTVEQYAIWSIIKLKRLLLPSWRSSDGMVPSCYCWSEHFSALTASISTVFLAVLPSRSPREGFISWWCVSTKNHHP